MSYRIKLTGNVLSYRGWGKTATKRDPVVEVDTWAAVEEAVASGCFVLLDEPAEKKPEKEQAEPTEEKTGTLDPEQLSTMKFDDLKRLAEDMGIDVSGIRKKTDLVAAIAAVEVEYAEDDDSEEVPDGIFG